MRVQKPQAVGRREGEQRIAVAQYVMAQGMTAKECILEVVVNQFRGGIAIGVYFVENHLHFALHLTGRETGVQQEVAHQLDGPSQMFRQEYRVDDRLLLRRVGIEFTAHRLHTVENVPRPAAGGTLEKKMLHKVGQAIFTGSLVARTGIDGKSRIRYLRRHLLVYHAQPVGQGKGRIVGHGKHLFSPAKVRQ